MQLNCFPITLDFDEYQMTATPYSEERLIQLRKQYNNTHSFFRHGESIYISNKDGDDNISLGTLTNLKTSENSEITSSLIKHLFFRTFKDRFAGYIPVDFYPFRFFSGQEKDDIIYKLLPSSLQNRICYKKLIEVQLRQLQLNGKKQFGFIISIRRNWIFNISCAELNSQGYNLNGTEVLHAEVFPGMTNILAPNEEFIGVIQNVIGSKARVETNEGVKDYELSELFIKKSSLNIGNYLSFALSQKKSEEIISIIKSRSSEIHNTKHLYNEILKTANHLFFEKEQPVLFQNKDGFCFTVSRTPLKVFNTLELKIPTFIFDYACTKTNNTNPDQGLLNFGPYDSINFDIKSPNILSICHRTNRGHFTKFLSNLKDGISNSTYFQKGLLKKYDLQDVIFDLREIQSYSVEEYLTIITNYDERKPHLAIIEIPANFRQIEDKSNPYFRIKAKLLSLEIPVQFVTSEKIANYNEYILNSFALQAYAKMGGTPWVLPSHRSVDKEIIIGIGHSWLRLNQFKGAESLRIVGITTFLSSDGQYLLSDKVKEVIYENYFAELLKSLTNSIKKLSSEQGWLEGDTIRLIFHIFKPIKNIEFDVINQLIKDIPEYKIKFAFVTISKSHPYLLFDLDQKGITKYGSTTLKGEFIPNRASNVFLDSETCIVQMFGANELKTTKHGMSNPIQIKIRTPQGKYDNKELHDILFYDLSYITQQIYSFTYLSWRSFLPGELPATMLYSNLISRLLSRMKNIPEWDPDKLNYSLKRKKWFL